MNTLLLIFFSISIFVPQFQANFDFQELTYRNFFPYNITVKFIQKIVDGQDVFAKNFKYQDCEGDSLRFTKERKDQMLRSLNESKLIDAGFENDDDQNGGKVYYWFMVEYTNKHRVDFRTTSGDQKNWELQSSIEHNCHPDNAILKTSAALLAINFVHYNNTRYEDKIANTMRFQTCDGGFIDKSQFLSKFNLTIMEIHDGVRFQRIIDPPLYSIKKLFYDSKIRIYFWQFSGKLGGLDVQLEVNEEIMEIIKGRQYPCSYEFMML